jgi:hypothetical protein
MSAAHGLDEQVNGKTLAPGLVLDLFLDLFGNLFLDLVRYLFGNSESPIPIPIPSPLPIRLLNPLPCGQTKKD